MPVGLVGKGERGPTGTTGMTRFCEVLSSCLPASSLLGNECHPLKSFVFTTAGASNP